MVVGIGTLLALDTFVSQSYGAGRIDECHRWLFAGMQLAVVLTLVLTGPVARADCGAAVVRPAS
jgi:MATE family multidrug resistance protein